MSNGLTAPNKGLMPLPPGTGEEVETLAINISHRGGIGRRLVMYISWDTVHAFGFRAG